MEKNTITAKDIKVNDKVFIVSNNQMIEVRVVSIDRTDDGIVFKLSNDDDYVATSEDSVLLMNSVYGEDKKAYTDHQVAYNRLRIMCLESLDALKKKYNVE